MRIDNDRLKALYRARSDGPGTSSRRDCPPPEKLLGVLKSQLSSRKATRVIDHLSQCVGCADEFGFLSEALRSESALLEDLERQLSRGRAEPSAGPGAMDRREPRREGRSLFARLSWRAVPLGVGLALALVMVSTRLLDRGPGTDRAEESARVEALRPMGEVAREGLVFAWKRLPGCDRYVLSLFDRALTPVWRSGPLPADSLHLPPETSARLIGGSPYFWMITAGRPDGREFSSTLTEFSVRD